MLLCFTMVNIFYQEVHLSAVTSLLLSWWWKHASDDSLLFLQQLLTVLAHGSDHCLNPTQVFVFYSCITALMFVLALCSLLFCILCMCHSSDHCVHLRMSWYFMDVWTMQCCMMDLNLVYLGSNQCVCVCISQTIVIAEWSNQGLASTTSVTCC